MPYRVVAPDSGKSRFVQLLPSYTMWGYLYPDTDATGTVRGLATPTPRQANPPKHNILRQNLRA